MNEDIRRADDQESEHYAGEEVRDHHNYVSDDVSQEDLEAMIRKVYEDNH